VYSTFFHGIEARLLLLILACPFVNAIITKFSRIKLSVDKRTDCVPCPAGTYADATSDLCQACPLGKYAPKPMDGCLTCGEGHATVNTTAKSVRRGRGAKSCEGCNAGEYAPEQSWRCKYCPAGYYSPPSSPACTICAKGFYTTRNSTDASPNAWCTSCSSGKYAPRTGMTTCLICTRGRSQVATGQSFCTGCEAGKYQDGSQAVPTSCQDCPAGKYQTNTSQSSCVDCPIGRYNPDTGESSCERCPVEHVANQIGSLRCEKCPSPTTTNGTDRINCTGCRIGNYWDGSRTNDATSPSSHCFSCATGFEKGCSESPGEIDGGWTTKERYLEEAAVKNTWYRFADSTHQAYECNDYSEYPENCGGGPEVGDSSCLHYATGALCRQCEENRFHDGDTGECVECSESTVMTSMIPLITVAGLLVVGFLMWKLSMWFRLIIEGWAEEHKVQLDWWLVGARIIFFDYLIITKFTELQDVNWPSPFKEFVLTLNLVFLDVSTVVPGVECLGEWSHYMALLLWTVAPLVLYLLMLLILSTRTWFVFTCTRGDEEEGAPKANSLRQAIIDALLEGTGSFFEILALVHTLVCVRIFQTFNCVEFDGGSDESRLRLLRVDFRFSCEKEEHEKYELYAYFMVVLYVVLFPAILSWFKWRNHYSQASKRNLTQTPFKYTFWWFDAVDLYYRLSMTGLLLAAEDDRIMRIVMSIFISVCFLSVITHLRPFLAKSHNSLMTTGQFVVCVTMTSGYVVENLNKKRAVIAYMLLFFNIGIVVAAVVQQRRDVHFSVLKNIENQQALDARSISNLLADGPFMISITESLLKSVEECIDSVAFGYRIDFYWNYLTTDLFSLIGPDGKPIFDLEIPDMVDWISYVEEDIDEALGEEGFGGVNHWVVLHEGWMSKKGKVNTSEKLRYCLLVQDTVANSFSLFYFGSETAAARMLEMTTEEGAKGRLQLERVSDVWPDQNKRLIKLLDVNGRMWEFRVQSPEDYSEWFEVINETVKRALDDSEEGGKTYNLEAFRKVATDIYGPLLPTDASDVIAAVFNRLVLAQTGDDTDRSSRSLSRKLSRSKFAAQEQGNPMRSAPSSSLVRSGSSSTGANKIPTRTNSASSLGGHGAPGVPLEDSDDGGGGGGGGEAEGAVVVDEARVVVGEEDETEGIVVEINTSPVDSVGGESGGEFKSDEREDTVWASQARRPSQWGLTDIRSEDVYSPIKRATVMGIDTGDHTTPNAKVDIEARAIVQAQTEDIYTASSSSVLSSEVVLEAQDLSLQLREDNLPNALQVCFDRTLLSSTT
jgi:hypothetical protein